jgi:hypothetical protein
LAPMKCRLCGAEAKLCNSHIIPEFCFKSLYDSHHRFVNVYDLRNMKSCLGQSGFSEPMLCGACESLFAKYERHARRVFTDPLPPPRAGTKRFFDLPRVDAFRFRYFLLSILWRAGEASHEVFSHVDLGARHEETLREHLLAETLPHYCRFGCWVLALHHDDEQMKSMIVEPTYGRIEGHRVYRFVFAGLVLFAFVSSHPLPEVWTRLLLGSSPMVTIYRADLPELGFLRHALYGS